MARSFVATTTLVVIGVLLCMYVPSSGDAAVYNETLAKVLVMYSAAAYSANPPKYATPPHLHHTFFPHCFLSSSFAALSTHPFAQMSTRSTKHIQTIEHI
jgi:hypothetical protein